MNWTYESPLKERYKSDVSGVFSDHFKYTYWRELWTALATAEAEFGLPISDEQVLEMQLNVSNVDMKRATELENELHHDVMAHIKLYGECCPKAAPIIHLGATSCFVTDNTEVRQMECALSVIYYKLRMLLGELLRNVKKYELTECVAYTHFQKAELTTLGKRFALWARDIEDDIERIKYELDHIKYLGCKGAVGTLASFVSLFNGDTYKAIKLDERVAEIMGFSGKLAYITGQTYNRKQDFHVLQVLSNVCQSASKFANDIRLLSHTGEVREGFSERQVGSSAMPFKRNPIRCEKISSLSRYVITMVQNSAMTAATQWLERSLDDSANRRVLIPEAFMLTCHIIEEYIRVVEDLVVDEEVIKRITASHVQDSVAEEVIMYGTSVLGMERNTVHERIRGVTAVEGKLLNADTISDILNTSVEVSTGIMERYKENAIGAARQQSKRMTWSIETDH